MTIPAARKIKKGGAAATLLGLLLLAGPDAGAEDVRARHQQVNGLLNQAISTANSDPRTRGYANQLRSLQNQMNSAFSHYNSLPPGPFTPIAPNHAPLAGQSPVTTVQPLPGNLPAANRVPAAAGFMMASPHAPADAGALTAAADPLSQSVLNTGSSLETEVLRTEPSPVTDELRTAFPVDDSGAVAASGAGLSFGTNPTASAAPAGDEWNRLLADTDQTLRQTDDWLAAARQDPAMREAVAVIDQARQALRDAQQLLEQQQLASPDGSRPRLQGDLPDLYGTRQWLLAGGYADRSVFSPFHIVPAAIATPAPPAGSTATPLVVGPVAFAASTGQPSQRHAGNPPWNDPNVVDLRNAATLVPVIPGGTTGARLPATSPSATPPTASSTAGAPNGPGTAPAASGDDSTPASRFGPILTPLLPSPENQKMLNLLTDYLKAGADAGLNEEKAKELLDDALAGGKGYLAATGELKEKVEAVLELKEFWDADTEGRAEIIVSDGWEKLTGSISTAGFTHAIVAKSYTTITEKVLDNFQNTLDDFSNANNMPGINLREGFIDSLTSGQRIIMNVLELDETFADKQNTTDRKK